MTSAPRILNAVFCCAAIEETPNLDPRIASFVAWAKTKDDDALPYQGTLVNLQNKPFGIGLYVRQVHLADLDSPPQCGWKGRPHTYFVPVGSEGEIGKRFLKLKRLDNDILYELVSDFVHMKMYPLHYTLYFAENNANDAKGGRRQKGVDERQDEGRHGRGDKGEEETKEEEGEAEDPCTPSKS